MLIEALEDSSGLNRTQLHYIARTASKRYKVYYIKKRNGKSRRIEHPRKDLKAIQRWLNNYLFEQIPVHENATAYKKGSNIRINAERHLNTRFTLRMDFKDFFPSFKAANIRAFLANYNAAQSLNFTEWDLNFICKIITRDDELTIGAPSSPIIANFMMYDFDEMMTEFSHERGLIYTRYADDLFISSKGPKQLSDVPKKIIETVHKYDHVSLKINHQKTTSLSRKYKRSITGLIVTPDNKVSLGRDRKRYIRTLIYLYLKNELPEEGFYHLRGLIAFAMDAEGCFYESLVRKYGQKALHDILGKNTD